MEQDVERLLVMKGTDPAVRKKAALCFLRFFRENPGNPVHSELADKMVTAVCYGVGLMVVLPTTVISVVADSC